MIGLFVLYTKYCSDTILLLYICSGGKNGTSLLNGTSLAPSANSTADQSGSTRTAILAGASFLQLLVLLMSTALQLL